MGESPEYDRTGWVPINVTMAQKVCDENLSWLEHIYKKIGTQIKLEPIGYTK